MKTINLALMNIKINKILQMKKLMRPLKNNQIKYKTNNLLSIKHMRKLKRIKISLI